MNLKSFQNAVSNISKQFTKDMADIAKLPEKKQEPAKQQRFKQIAKHTDVIDQEGYQYAKPSPFEKQVIQMLLLTHLRKSGFEFVLGNFQYMSATMDCFCLSRDRVMEFSVITDKASYDAEFKKIFHMGNIKVQKHAQLKSGKALQNFFWLVISKYTDFELKPQDVPAYCGILYAYVPFGKVLPVFSIVRAAPMLHDKFIPNTTYKHIAAHLQRRNEALNAKYGHGVFKIFNPDRDDVSRPELDFTEVVNLDSDVQVSDTKLLNKQADPNRTSVRRNKKPR